MKTSDRLFSIEELSSLTGFKKRTIRYYIQKEIVDAPEGMGKGAVYTYLHLEQLLALKKWKSAGLSLDRIRELIRSQDQLNDSDSYLPPVPKKNTGHIEVWSHIHLNQGAELHIEPTQSGLSPEQIRSLCQEIIKVFEQIKSEESS